MPKMQGESERIEKPINSFQSIQEKTKNILNKLL